MDKACHCKVIKRLNEQFTMKACHLEPQHAYVSGQGMCLTSKIAKRRQQIHGCVVNGNDNVILLSHREHILSRPRATWTGANFKQIPMTKKKNMTTDMFSQSSMSLKINMIITLLPTTSELITTNREN